MTLSRRDLLKSAGVGTLLGAGGGALAQQAVAGAMAGVPAAVPYELPKLPYGYDALEPGISAAILRLHHDKHHAAYVAGLNATLAKLEKARDDAAQVQALCRDLAFHGSGHVLHCLYWLSMTPGGSGEPAGDLRATIERDFGSFDMFRKQFVNAAVRGEASAWAVLGWEPLGRRLLILQAENHQHLTIWGIVPLMVCDVWEHAYYLQYENRRAEYVEAFWKLADWRATAARFAASLIT